MADETRNANVVLTADVSGYQQGTTQAYQQTNKLTESVNKLAASLDGITKRVGKKLLIFSAADTAAMAGFVTVTAKYEKQLATLDAQMKISGRNFMTYKKGIDDLTKALPVTRGEMAQLITAINQMGIVSERQALGMARTFTNLSAATGEDVGALTQGMIELSRQMGTLAGNDLSGFADSLTQVSNNAGVSATSVLSFAQSISPFARAAGIGQKELLGISAAFTRAGADGFAAANTFNTMLADITRQVQTGSPAIAKYSNAIGVTVEQFEQMDATERIVQIFEAVNAAGPDAIKLLDRMGFDGIRAAKSIQAVANEQGGLRKAIEDSRDAFGGGATARGAENVYVTLDSKITKMRTNLEQMGSAIGEGVMPFAKVLLDVFNKMLEVTNAIASPLLTLAGALGSLLAPVSAAVGGLMTMLGPLSTAMLAMTAFRFSPARAMIEGARTARGGDPLREAAVGARNGPWYMSGAYRMGERGGGLLNRVSEPGSVAAMGSRYHPLQRVGGWMLARNPLGLSVAQVAEGNAQLYRNAGMRDWWNRQSVVGTGLGTAGTAVSGFFGSTRQAAGAALSDPRAFFSGLRDAEASKKAAEHAKNLSTAMAAGTTATVANNAAKATNTTATAANTVSTRSLAASAGVATRALIGLQLATAKFGLSLAAQGVGAAGRGLFGLLGGLVGVGGNAGVAVGAGLAAAGAGYAMYSRQNEVSNMNIIGEDTTRNIGATNNALGLSTEKLTEFADAMGMSVNAQKQYQTVTQAMIGTIRDATAAMGEYADQRVEGLASQQQAVAFLQSMGTLNPQQAASLTGDMMRRFGAGGQGVINQYLAQTNGGANPYAGNMAGNLIQGAIETQSNNTGILGLSRWFSSEDMTEQVNSAFVAAIEASSATSVARHGDKAVAQKMGTYINDILYNSFDIWASDSSGTMGFGMEVGRTQEQVIKQLEAYFGGEGGYAVTPVGVKSSLGGDYITSTEQLMSDLLNKENTSDLAQRVQTWAENAGINAEDFAQGGVSLARKASLAASGTTLSDWERQVQGVGMGRFARENELIRAVTEGTEIGNPIAVQRAIDTMATEAMKGGKSLGEVTTEFQRLKQAVGDVEDPLYQLANAALAVVRQQSLYTAQAQGGSLGAMQERMGANQAILNTPVSTEAGAEEWRAAAQDVIAARGELRGNILQYEQMLFDANKAQDRAQDDYDRSRELARRDRNRQVAIAEQDFYISRVRAMEDFGRNMRRAAEDASKSFFNPFARLESKQVTSSATIAANSREQLQMLKNIPKNLRKLREMGVSQAVIDTLNLTDPQMFQQLQSLVDEGQGLDVRGLNRNVGRRRTNAAAAVLETQQGTRRGREDFARSMERGADDFQRSMDRAAEAFQISLDDMAKSFDISKDRTIQDIKDYGREVTGSLEEILAQTTTVLFDDLGIKGTQFLTRLENYLKIPGLDEEGMPVMPTTSDYGITVPPKAEEALGSGVTAADAKTHRTAGYNYVPMSGAYGSTTVNKNTVFSGPVSVTAQDPNEMGRKLAEKARLANLRRGAQAAPVSAL